MRRVSSAWPPRRWARLGSRRSSTPRCCLRTGLAAGSAEARSCCEAVEQRLGRVRTRRPLCAARRSTSTSSPTATGSIPRRPGDRPIPTCLRPRPRRPAGEPRWRRDWGHPAHRRDPASPSPSASFVSSADRRSVPGRLARPLRRNARCEKNKGPWIAPRAFHENNSPATTYSPTHLRSAVPSALRGLTAVFGMGTGVSPSPESPEKLKSVKEPYDGTESRGAARSLAYEDSPASKRIRLVKPNDRLVRVSSTPRSAYTSRLSTWSSSRGLQGDLISRGASRLDAFSVYPFRT